MNQELYNRFAATVWFHPERERLVSANKTASFLQVRDLNRFMHIEEAQSQIQNRSRIERLAKTKL
jgi:hypothetical protein